MNEHFLTPALRRLAAVLSLLVPLAFASAQAAQPAQPVGHITFAVGEAHVIAADGSRHPARAEAAVYEGERLATGADGYLHLRMVDEAFAALRPGSVLRLTRYAYDPARPGASAGAGPAPMTSPAAPATTASAAARIASAAATVASAAARTASAAARVASAAAPASAASR